MQVSAPPEACLEVCAAVPEVRDTLSAWAFEVIPLYADCAVAKAQCRNELLKRLEIQ